MLIRGTETVTKINLKSIPDSPSYLFLAENSIWKIGKII